MNYIFLDEVQNVKEFERLVDGLFIKNNTDIYITGSNAYMFSGELATHLTGRYVEIDMYPYSFKECYSLYSNSQNSSKSESFGNFIYHGGIPEVLQLDQSGVEKGDNLANSMLNTIIEKDIFSRTEIYNKATFQKIIDFLFSAVGSTISPHSISTYFMSEKIAIDHKTIANYLQYIHDSMLMEKVERYDIKGKGLLRTFNKYYIADSRFRRIRLKTLAISDYGHLLENAVFFELKRRFPFVQIGKSGEYEIDFITRNYQGDSFYYQVAWRADDEKTLERELRPLENIKDHNNKFLITVDYDHNPNYNGIKKLYAPSWFLGDTLPSY
jgi:predicted AAA+ superfamily ATPase